MPRLLSRPALLRATFAAALAGLAAPLAGCQDFGDVTGSIPASATQPTDDAKLRAYAEDLGKRYDRNPGDKTALIEYARALRALTRYNEAVAVIQTAAIKTPKDFDLLGEYGKALADAGQLTQAKDVSWSASASALPYSPSTSKSLGVLMAAVWMTATASLYRVSARNACAYSIEAVFSPGLRS